MLNTKLPTCPACHSNERVTLSPPESADRGEYFCPCNEPGPNDSGHFSPRPPHQQRVIDEKTALDDLRTKLGTFIESNPIFNDLGTAEQERLLRQIGAMTAYSMILGERIAAFS